MGSFILYIVVGFGIFLALRGLNCWYFRINEQITLERERNELLKNILVKLQGTDSATSTPSTTNSPFDPKEGNEPSTLSSLNIKDRSSLTTCSHCGADVLKDEERCSHCHWIIQK